MLQSKHEHQLRVRRAEDVFAEHQLVSESSPVLLLARIGTLANRFAVARETLYRRPNAVHCLLDHVCLAIQSAYLLALVPFQKKNRDIPEADHLVVNRAGVELNIILRKLAGEFRQILHLLGVHSVHGHATAVAKLPRH